MTDQQTTTVDAAGDDGAEEALPSEAVEQESADTGAEDQGIEQSEGGETQPPEVDDKLKKYAESQGLELDSPSAIKAAKIAMNNQSEVTRRHHRDSQLKKSMETVADSYAEEEAQATGADPENTKLLKRLLVRDSIREFYDTNPEAREHEAEMAKVITERPYLANDLEAAYALVQTRNPDAFKSQGKREALQQLASKQRTAVPSGSAVSSAVTTKPAITRAEIARRTQAGDMAWLDKNQGTINQMVSEGTLQ